MAERKNRKEAARPKAKPAGAKSRAAAKKNAPAKKAAGKAGAPNQNIDNALDIFMTDTNQLLNEVMAALNMKSALSPAERARLIGAGVRNYGFIEKARDIARDNPGFLPPNFEVTQFSADLQTFDKVRQLFFIAEKLQTILSDKMLLMSNDLYRESLRVYNSLKEQSKARVAGARDLFIALEIFFKKRKPSDRPPTEAQEVKKAKGIIKGTIDGEMLLRNEKAKKSGGVHEVVEDIRKEQIAGKETAEFNASDK